MAKSSASSVLPIVLLGGLAVFLLMRPRIVGAGVATPPQGATNAAALRDAAKFNAIGNAISSLSGLFGTPAPGTPAYDRAWGFYGNAPLSQALDGIVAGADAWQKAYGDAAGEDGDPYY